MSQTFSLRAFLLLNLTESSGAIDESKVLKRREGRTVSGYCLDFIV